MRISDRLTRYSRDLAVARDAVTAAAALCRTVQSSIDPAVLEKKDRSPVTVADFGSQAVVCRALREAFPEDPIVAEEDAAVLRRSEDLCQKVARRVAAVLPEVAVNEENTCAWIDAGNAKGGHGRFWTLDPIDGTKGFLRGEHYAVALALIENGEVKIGVLGCPNLMSSDAEAGGTLLWAVRAEGTWQMPLAGRPTADGQEKLVIPANEPGSPSDWLQRFGRSRIKSGMTSAVKVSGNTRGADARLTESVESRHSSHSKAAAVSERLGITAEPLRLDSQVKYAVVARGEADIYLRLLTVESYREKIWDHAAGALLVTEAGGQVTDRRGQPLDFTAGIHLGPHKDIVVTNGHLHEAVLQALGNDE